MRISSSVLAAHNFLLTQFSVGALPAGPGFEHFFAIELPKEATVHEAALIALSEMGFDFKPQDVEITPLQLQQVNYVRDLFEPVKEGSTDERENTPLVHFHCPKSFVTSHICDIEEALALVPAYPRVHVQRRIATATA